MEKDTIINNGFNITVSLQQALPRSYRVLTVGLDRDTDVYPSKTVVRMINIFLAV